MDLIMGIICCIKANTSAYSFKHHTVAAAFIRISSFKWTELNLNCFTALQIIHLLFLMVLVCIELFDENPVHSIFFFMITY